MGWLRGMRDYRKRTWRGNQPGPGRPPLRRKKIFSPKNSQSMDTAIRYVKIEIEQ